MENPQACLIQAERIQHIHKAIADINLVLGKVDVNQNEFTRSIANQCKFRLQESVKTFEILPSIFQHYVKLFNLVDQIELQFRTLQESRACAIFLSQLCPNPENALLGLSELMINAIEHGNLEISFEEKADLLLRNKWLYEIEARMQDARFKKRLASVTLRRNKDEIKIVITDQGKGFDWSYHLDLEPGEITEKHGRGITIANYFSFDEMQYNSKGNVVTCVIER